MRWRPRRLLRGGVFVAALLAVVSGAPAATARTGGAGSGPSATIRYTEHGIPHILAGDFTGLGYGYGYAVAKDNICVLANSYLTVDAQRSRYLGPGGSGDDTITSATSNLNSDLYFQSINDSGVVERLVAQPAPMGPRQEIRDIVSGYVQGYNRYLAGTGADGVADPACHGAAWLKPITDTDVYRLVYAMTLYAGRGNLADGIVNAQPPVTAAAAKSAASAGSAKPGKAGAPAVPSRHALARAEAALARTLDSGELGSNGIGIGSSGTAQGASSVLLGNPHFSWRGADLFWQTQLTVPGKMNVSGAGLLGTPFLIKGYNNDIAWTHTLATSRTFGLYQLTPAPGDPTSYLVDGVPEKMTSRTVHVQVKQDDGTLSDVSRTFYSTRYGPMITSGLGLSLPWTTSAAFTVRDANTNNMRALNTWFGIATAKNTDDIVTALTTTQGAPWNNTIATDRAGHALFADIQVVPNVTDDLANQCATPLGSQLFPATGIPVLDGSKTSCAWGTDAGSLEPGLFAPSRLPRLTRRDYVLNSNDSPWLANTGAPITGYPRIVGDVGTPRSMRTRESITSVQEGLQAGGFTRQSMQDMLFADRSRVAVLAAADTAKMCAAFPDGQAPSANGPVDVSQGCGALAAWNGNYTPDSRGSLLFQRFVLKLASVPGGGWSTPFDPNNPVTTPNTLDTASAAVQQAFGDAAAELHAANIPLDAPLGDHQTVTRGTKIPMPGAPEALGVLNVVRPTWDPAQGNVDVRTGSSYIQVVSFSGDAPPDATTLLTTSESSDPTSPYYADQTEMFSAGQWVRARFCESDILASPDLQVVQLP